MQNLKQQRQAKLFLSVLFSCFSSLCFSQDSQINPQDLEVYFDAEEYGVSRDGGDQEFKGNVVAIGLGVFIGADHIFFNKNKNILRAEGHVVLLMQTNVFVGKRIEFSLTDKTFAMFDGQMTAKSPEDRERFLNDVLGFSPKELQFEKDRKEQLKENERKRLQYLKEVSRKYEAGQLSIEDAIQPYHVILKQKKLIELQENGALAQMSKNKRDAFKRRRNFWKSKKAGSSLGFKKLQGNYYFRIEGEKIEKIDAFTYLGEKTSWSPCKCDEDEEPAWGFHAQSLEAQPGGYADMSNAVLTIKGLPILYLPRMLVPLKEERQSGFLLPTLVHKSETGNVFGLPLFLDLSDSSDATLQWEFIEKRGQRLGLEYRVQNREYSGWKLNIEGMRDQKWLRDKARRKEIYQNYKLGLLRARTNVPQSEIPQDPNSMQALLDSREWWEENYASCLDADDVDQCLEENKFGSFDPPNNAWRGRLGWQGLSIIAPRLSFVSSGKVFSDHRYIEDTYIAQSIQEAFDGDRVETFAFSDFKFHLDGSNMYVGVSSHLIDNGQLDKVLDGHQMPSRIVAQSRLFRLTPEDALLPLYGQIEYESRRISDRSEHRTRSGAVSQSSDLSLRDGNWSRSKFSMSGPIANEGILQIDHFEELEVREIEYQYDERTKTKIESWKTGLKFYLPVEGDIQIGHSYLEDQRLPLFIRHSFDLGIRVSLRPYSKRSGKYGRYEAKSIDQFVPTYFTADLGKPTDDDREFISEKYRIDKNRTITFSTNHSWSTYNKQQPGKKLPQKNQISASDTESLKEQARLEILHYLSQSFPDGSESFKEVNYNTPVHFHADISYDFEKLEERKKAEEERSSIEAENSLLPSDDPRRQPLPELPEPWSTLNTSLNVRANGYSLNKTMSYDIYKKVATKLAFGLSLPSFFATNVGLTYTIEKQPEPSDDQGNFKLKKTTTRSAAISSNFIPYFNLLGSYSIRDIEAGDDGDAGEPNQNERQYKSGFSYESPSDCWGLSFLRTVDFGRDNREAEYRVELNIIFMGTQRTLPNMASSLLRGVSKEES